MPPSDRSHPSRRTGHFPALFLSSQHAHWCPHGGERCHLCRRIRITCLSEGFQGVFLVPWHHMTSKEWAVALGGFWVRVILKGAMCSSFWGARKLRSSEALRCCPQSTCSTCGHESARSATWRLRLCTPFCGKNSFPARSLFEEEEDEEEKEEEEEEGEPTVGPWMCNFLILFIYIFSVGSVNGLFLRL